MKVLVLGGTGYLGRRISERFCDAGHEVTVVSRGRLHAGVLARVEHLQLDRKDRETFAAAFRGRRFDVVADNIAYERDDTVSAIRTFAGRAGHYLCTSSVAVYSKRFTTRPLLESDADLTLEPSEAEGGFHPSRGLAYAAGKRQAELELRRHGDELPYTTLRAPIVVGPDDRTLRVWWFVQRIEDGGPLIVPEWGSGRIFQVVFADDLADAFVAAAGNPAAFCKAYNIAQADVLTPETWIAGFAAALGTDAETARIPEELLAPAGLDGYALPIAGRPFGHLLLDTGAARRDLGFEPTAFEDWMRLTAAGCAASPPAQDSEGYGRRQAEVEVARRFEALQREVYGRLARAR